MKIKVSKIVPTVCVYLVLLLFLTKTNPRHLPLPLLIVPFILLFIGVYLPVKALGSLYLRGLPVETKGKARQNKSVPLMVALFVTFLLVLSSINQLGVKDVLLGGVLVAGLVFYIKRFRVV